jgi:hypothetical protein
LRDKRRKLGIKLGIPAESTNLLRKEMKNLKGTGQRIASKTDPILPPGQHWILMSWVAPKGTRQRSKTVAVKIRGVFDTWQEADNWAKDKLHPKDPDFDIHIVKMGEWIVVPPPSYIEDQIHMKYQQPVLDKIMDGHYKSVDEGRRKLETRMSKAREDSERKMRQAGHSTATRPTDEQRKQAEENVQIDISPEKEAEMRAYAEEKRHASATEKTEEKSDRM